jgi:hypothetical protein
MIYRTEDSFGHDPAEECWLSGGTGEGRLAHCLAGFENFWHPLPFRASMGDPVTIVNRFRYCCDIYLVHSSQPVI